MRVDLRNQLSTLLWLVPFAIPFTLGGYPLRLALVTVFTVLLAVSLNILYGYTGQASLGHAAFYGIGAYASALVVMKLGLPLIAGIIVATGLVLLISLVVGWTVLRASGLYFSIITLAFSVVVYQVLQSWTDVTRGSLGLRGVPTLFQGPEMTFVLVYAALLGILAFKRALVDSYVGLAFLAIREDEPLAAEMGITTHRFKTLSFAITSTIAGLAGALFAHYSGFLAPSMFTLFRSFELFVVVTVGGAGTFFGPIVGGVILTLLPEVLREVEAFRQVVYGLLLVVIIMFFPEGIVGTIRERSWAQQVTQRLRPSTNTEQEPESGGERT